MKKILCIWLSVLLLCGLVFPAFAQEDAPVYDGTLKIADMNVDGLPVPARFSKDNKSPVTSARSIVEFLNAADADIITTQENFNLYPIYKRGLNAPYLSAYDGGVAVGDGLATAAKFPLCDVRHIAWDSACGILNNGSDELTPKGFMVSTIELADGVFVDVYNLHADANEDEGSLQAKREQFDQLCSFIQTYSGDRAVIIAGDFNSNYTIVLGDVLREKFVADGFRDTWVEVKNDGDYYPKYGEQIEKWQAPSYWGYFDCLDKVYYRDGAGVTLTALEHEYVFCETANKTGEQVRASDHAAIITTLGYTLTGEQSEETHTPEAPLSVPTLIAKAIRTIGRTLRLILTELPALIRGEIEIGWNK